mgnify:CR=1 FL=1
MKKNINHIFAVILTVIGLMSSQFAISQVTTVSVVGQPTNLVSCYGTVNPYISTLVSVQSNAVLLPGVTWDIYYQWFKKNPDASFSKVGAELKNSGQLTYASLAFSNSGNYRCESYAKTSDSLLTSSNTVTSNECVVNVLSAGMITRQPTKVYANIGDVVVLDFDAHVTGQYGVVPNYLLPIQWFQGTTAIVDNNDIAGAKSNRMTIRVTNANQYTSNYYATVTGQCGVITTAQISIEKFPTITINSQPADVAVCVNTDAMAMVNASASNSATLAYQWYAGSTMLVNQTSPKISGAMTPTLTWTATAAMTGIYCMISTTDGMTSKASSSISLTVNTAPMITMQPSATISGQISKPFSIEVMATSTPSASYSWSKDGAAIAGANSSTFSVAIAAATDAGVYTCQVNNPCGSVTSAAATVSVTQEQIVVASVNGEDFNTVGLHTSTPNPVNDLATLNFTLANSANATLVLIDATGYEVAQLFNGVANAGLNKLTISANSLNLASGVYYLKLTSGELTQTKQLVVTK